MKLDGKNVLMVIASNNFRDEEYAEPRKALEDAGAHVTVACSSLNTAKGKLGLEVKPDILITNVEESDYDGIVFVGGGGSKEYFDSPIAHKLAQNFYSKGKLASAICIAPAILANAGLLKGKKQRSSRHQERRSKQRALFLPAAVWRATERSLREADRKLQKNLERRLWKCLAGNNTLPMPSNDRFILQLTSSPF